MKIKSILEVSTTKGRMMIMPNDLDKNGRLKKPLPAFVSYDLSFSDIEITSLEGFPNHVGGYFWCSGANFTSLQHAPEKVDGNFWCVSTPITSLVGGPRRVGGDYICHNTHITSLEGVARIIGGELNFIETPVTSLAGIHKQIDSIGGLIVPSDNVKSNVLGLLLLDNLSVVSSKEMWAQIVQNHLTTKDVLDCQEELIKAGLKEFAKL